jgi:transcriptional regulator with XRE-family HTH domain
VARKPVTTEDKIRGTRLLELREHYGFSQSEVCPENHTQVINVEKGRNKLRGPLALTYARAFGVEPEVLLAYAVGMMPLGELVRLSSKKPKKEKHTEHLDRAINQVALELERDTAAEIVVRAGYGIKQAMRAVDAVVAYEPARAGDHESPSPERMAKLAIALLKADAELGEPPQKSLRLSDAPGSRRRR